LVSQGKLAMIIHVARVLSSVVVTDQLCHTRSFIGAYSSKSTLSVIVLVFLKIIAIERSRCRGGGADYKLHKTSSSICIGSGNSSKHSQVKVGEFHFWIWMGALGLHRACVLPCVSCWPSYVVHAFVSVLLDVETEPVRGKQRWLYMPEFHWTDATGTWW